VNVSRENKGSAIKVECRNETKGINNGSKEVKSRTQKLMIQKMVVFCGLGWQQIKMAVVQGHN